MQKGNLGEAGAARFPDKSRGRHQAGPTSSLRKSGSEKRPLAEAGEVEVDGDGVAFGGIHIDGGGISGEVFGGEFKLESGADERATTVLRTDVVRLA